MFEVMVDYLCWCNQKIKGHFMNTTAIAIVIVKGRHTIDIFHGTKRQFSRLIHSEVQKNLEVRFCGRTFFVSIYERFVNEFRCLNTQKETAAIPNISIDIGENFLHSFLR